jgi:hypothetical protein
MRRVSGADSALLDWCGTHGESLRQDMHGPGWLETSPLRLSSAAGRDSHKLKIIENNLVGDRF